jgi:hypothetical protein
MSHFPRTFAEQIQELPADLGERGNAARDRLAENGFEVVAEITRELLPQLMANARQESTLEWCPKEPGPGRFENETSTELWLDKGDKTLDEYGRGLFLLMPTLGNKILPVEKDEKLIVGHGWEGPEVSPAMSEVDPTPIIPGGTTTFALRMSEAIAGRRLGLARDFTELIVAGSAIMYGAKDVWLETWKGNSAAVRTYGQVGFEYVHEKPHQERPTRKPVGYEFPDGHVVYLNKKNVPVVEDTRLWASYPNKLLPKAVLAA